MEIRTLDAFPVDELHRTFCTAFGDYSVPMQLSFSQFSGMLTRNAVRLDASAGLFSDGKLCGFILNGVRESVAYDSGTAIIPEERGKGYSKALLDFAIGHLKELGIGTYLLEVLQDNGKALKLYSSRNFVKSRELYCYQLKPGSLPDPGIDLRLSHVPHGEAAGFLKSFRPLVEPSFQNSCEAVIDASLGVYSLELEGRRIGFLAGSKESVAQVYISPEHRRKGAATKALILFCASTGSEALRIINIDAGAENLNQFFRRLGGSVFASQFEMKRAL